MFGIEKLDWWIYQTVKINLRICLLVLTEYTNVADTRTDRDGRTDGRMDTVGRHSRAYTWHRAAKLVIK